MLSIVILAKVTIAFALVLAFVAIARRASAALKHAMLVAGQLAALSIPLLGMILPPLAVNVRAVQPRAIVDAPAPLIEDGGAPMPASPLPRRMPNAWMSIWLAGCAIVAASKLTAFARAALIVRRAARADGVLLSDEVEQPSTFFHWILLPRAARASRAVLLHEQAHVMRRDTLLGLIGDAACAVYWFHPLAWLTARRGRLERERACDDLVLARGIAAEDYAAAMIEVARTLGRRTAAMPMAERSQLEQRIRAVLDPTVCRRTSGAMLVVTAILCATPLLAALTPSAKVPRPQSIEPDLLGDAIASPFSERIEPATPRVNVTPAGPDAALIELLNAAANRPKREPHDFVAERARWALTQMRGEKLVEPLIEALRHSDWRVRAYAAWALGHSHDGRATDSLLPLLDEPIWRVRAMAAHALATLGDPRAEQAMLRMIDDPAWQVRAEVVRYLRTVGGDRATIAAMKQDRHVAVRRAAVR